MAHEAASTVTRHCGGWSRNKARRFIRTLESGEDYLTDTRRTTDRKRVETRIKTGIKTLLRHPLRLVFNNTLIDRARDGDKGQDSDKTAHEHTTIEPDPLDPSNPNPQVRKVSKGAQSQASALLQQHPLHFNHYKRLFKPSNEEAVEAIEYFIESWESIFRKKHKALMPDEWEGIVNTILSVLDPDYGSAGDDIGLEESRVMMDRYFQTCFKRGCDYSILHYNSPGVKSKRFYEECY